MNPDNKPQNGNNPVMDVQRPRPGSALPPSPVQDNPMSPADNISTTVPQTVPPEQQPDVQRLPKKRGKMIALVILVIVLVIGIGAGVAWFILSQNASAPSPTTAPVTSTTDSQRVNAEEIEAASTEIDKTLNTLNDSEDFTPNDVSDTALGL